MKKSVSFLTQTDSLVEHEIRDELVIFIGYTHTKEQYERGFYKKKKRRKRSSTAKPAKDLELVEDPESDFVNPTDTGESDALDEVLDDLTARSTESNKGISPFGKKDLKGPRQRTSSKTEPLPKFGSLERPTKTKEPKPRTKSWAVPETLLDASPDAPTPQLPKQKRNNFTVSIVQVPGVPISSQSKKRKSAAISDKKSPVIRDKIRPGSPKTKRSSRSSISSNESRQSLVDTTKRDSGILNNSLVAKARDSIHTSPIQSPSPTSSRHSFLSSPLGNSSNNKLPSSPLGSNSGNKLPSSPLANKRMSAMSLDPSSPVERKSAERKPKPPVKRMTTPPKRASEMNLIGQSFMVSPPNSISSSPRASSPDVINVDSKSSKTFSTSGSLNIDFDSFGKDPMDKKNQPKIIDIGPKSKRPLSTAVLPLARNSMAPPPVPELKSTVKRPKSSYPKPPPIPEDDPLPKSRPKSVSMRKIKIQSGEIVDAKVVEMENGDKKVFISKKAKARSKSMMLDPNSKPILSKQFNALPPPPPISRSTDNLENYNQSYFDKKKRRTTFAKLKDLGSNFGNLLGKKF